MGGNSYYINNASTLRRNSIWFAGKSIYFDSNGGGAIDLTNGNNPFDANTTIYTLGGSQDAIFGAAGVNADSYLNFNLTRGTGTSDLFISSPLKNGAIINLLGNGILQLTASNNLVRGLTITGGTLELGNGGSSASLGVVSGTNTLYVGDSGNLTFNHSDTSTFGVVTSSTNVETQTLFGTGGLTQMGVGTLILNSSNTFSGRTLVAGGTLLLTNTGALFDSTLDASGGGALSFGSLTSATFGGLINSGTLTLTNTASAGVALSVGNNNFNTTFSGVLNGSAGSLTKLGAGSLNLSGSNSYGGGTTISSGTLQVGNDFALGPTTAPLAFTGGVLNVNGFNVNVGALSGTGNVNNYSAGSGTLTSAMAMPPAHSPGTCTTPPVRSRS